MIIARVYEQLDGTSIMNNPNSSRHQATKGLATTQTAPCRIVIVDDHPMVRLQLEQLLREHSGITVVGSAANGEEAVSLAQSLRPEIILMDFNMPKLNGAEATRQITACLPNTKVIGLSFNSDREVREAFTSAGAFGFVDKQLAAAQLYPAIMAAMHHN